MNWLAILTPRRLFGVVLVLVVIIASTIFRQNIEEFAKQQGWDTILVSLWGSQPEDTPVVENDTSIVPILIIAVLLGARSRNMGYRAIKTYLCEIVASKERK